MKSESLVMKLFFKLQSSFKMTCEAEGGFLASSPSSVSRSSTGVAVQGALLLTVELGLFKEKKIPVPPSDFALVNCIFVFNNSTHKEVKIIFSGCIL